MGPGEGIPFLICVRVSRIVEPGYPHKSFALSASGVRGPTRSLISLLEFLLDGQRCALRVGAVERVVPMVAISPLPSAPPIAVGLINLAGAAVPVVDARRRLGFPPGDRGLSARLLVTRARHHTLALPVDEVKGVIEVDEADITPSPAVLPGIGQVSGIAALPDGLLFIHDLDAFLSLDEERGLADALGALGA